jgi:rubrerythrin
MGNNHWTLNDLPWDQLDRSKADAEILKIIKAAALVEYNGRDYATYLCNVFSDDPEFQQVAREWAVEEVQHGAALGRWAELVDPEFSLEAAFKRFTAGYKIKLEATESIRGSRSGELIARCMVETGTSSYYTALGDATEEPVLKAICRRIAADELRHYKTFPDCQRTSASEVGGVVS